MIEENNKYSQILESLLALARSCGAEAADGIFIASTDISCSQRMGKQEGIERSESSGVGLRVFVSQKNGELSQASVSSTDVDKEALKEMADRAVAMARLAPTDNDSRLAPQELFPNAVPALDLLDVDEPTPAWLL